LDLKECFVDGTFVPAKKGIFRGFRGWVGAETERAFRVKTLGRA
jgi:hypothetical protein